MLEDSVSKEDIVEPGPTPQDLVKRGSTQTLQTVNL
jgi:hypothetical protein